MRCLILIYYTKIVLIPKIIVQMCFIIHLTYYKNLSISYNKIIFCYNITVDINRTAASDLKCLLVFPPLGVIMAPCLVFLQQHLTQIIVEIAAISNMAIVPPTIDPMITSMSLD